MSFAKMLVAKHSYTPPFACKMLEIVMLTDDCPSRRTRPFFFHMTWGMGRPVAMQINVTVPPSLAPWLGEIDTILDGTGK